MALSATFVADFSSFLAAVDKADAKLKTFEQDASKVNSTLSRFGNQFSGQKVIQDAVLMAKAIEEIGGVSKLTEDELKRVGVEIERAIEKMGKMGIEVPPQLQKLADSIKPIEDDLKNVATQSDKAASAATTDAEKMSKGFSGVHSVTEALGSQWGKLVSAFSASSLIDRAVGSVVDFGRAAVETASKLSDLSAKTGLSVEQLQRMEYVAKTSGSTLDAWVEGAQKFGINISKGTKDTADALDLLGLSLTKVRNMSDDMRLTTVLDALGNVQDASTRLRLGTELLGKSMGEMATGISDGYSDAAKDATVSTDEQIRQIKRLADEWDREKARMATGFTSLMGEAISKFRASPYVSGARALHEFIGPTLGLAPLPKETTAAEDEAANAKRAEAARQQARQIEEQERQKQERERIEKENAIAAKRAAEQRKQQAEEDQKLVDQYTGMGQVKDVQHTMALLQKAGSKPVGDALNKFLDDAVEASATLKNAGYDKAAAEIDAYVKSLRLADTSNRSFLQGLEVTNHALANQNKELHPLIEGLSQQSDRYKSIIAGLGQPGGVADTVKKAQEGLNPPKTGFLSGVTGAFDDFMGGMTGGKGLGGFMSKMGGQITKGFGDALSGGLNSAISVGVSLATQGVKKIWGSLTNAESRATNDARDKLIKATYGTEDALRKLAFQAGATDLEVRRVFGAHTQEAFQKSLAAVEKLIDRQKQLDSITKSYGGVDKFKELALQAGLTEEAVAGIFDPKNVDHFTDAVGEAQDAIEELQAEQEADAKRLDEAIQKYGFSFDELGRTLQNKKSQEQAKELIEDWRVLLDAGIDVNKVNEKMTDSIEDFVKQARRTGAEVPAAMRPMIQSMIDQGRLTDEAGNKFPDLEHVGLNFTDAMIQGFDKILKKLDALLDRLGLVPKAIDAIPDEKTITFTYVSDDQTTEPRFSIAPPGGSPSPGTGGIPAGPNPSTGIDPPIITRSFARGTRGRYLDFGSGTPAMLHGKERVVPEGELSAQAAGVQAIVDAVQALHFSVLRSMRDNAIMTRDQIQLARA